MSNVSQYVSAALALAMVIGVFVLLALAQPVPTELWTGFGLVIGFFFGDKSGAIAARLAAK